MVLSYIEKTYSFENFLTLLDLFLEYILYK